MRTTALYAELEYRRVDDGTARSLLRCSEFNILAIDNRNLRTTCERGRCVVTRVQLMIYEGALVAHRQAVSISKVQTEPSCYWQAWATTLHPADSARFHVDDSTKKKWTLHSAQLRELLQMLPQDSKCQILQRICPDYLMRQWTWRWVLSKRTSPVFFLYRTQKYSIVNGFRFCVMSPRLPSHPATTRQPGKCGPNFMVAGLWG